MSDFEDPQDADEVDVDWEKEFPEFFEFAADLHAEAGGPARGVVLVASAMVEAVLRRLIEKFLVADDSTTELLSGPNAPLGTFSARIKIALALGLLSENETKALNVIRTVRNKYAHELGAKISLESVTSSTIRLQTLLGVTPKKTLAKRGDLAPEQLFKIEFAAAASLISMIMTDRFRSIANEQRKLRPN